MNIPEDMEDHVSLDVHRLIAGSAVSSSQDGGSSPRSVSDATPAEHFIAVSCADAPKAADLALQDGYAYKAVPTSDDSLAGLDPEAVGEGASVSSSGEMAECRICQEEDEVENLETPCACSGSVKFAHRKCVQRWCNEKGDTICEICHQPYKSGYEAPPRPRPLDAITPELSGEWGITGSHSLDHINDPRILAMAAAERHFMDADYDEYAAADASGACWRWALLILMTVLLVRQTLWMAAAGTDEDVSTFFSLFLMRAAGFLLPCYIMARAMNTLQRRRQRQEAAMAAAEVAFILQSGQARAVHIAVAPGSAPAHELP
ncbi:hypothetical protein R1sor_021561 [Riccia sorocarpa]|uniref:RING-CH-type domain-containing protein n=1 Tax=Riccia sorocarpa TaxID=122646 RepID=A0ABD3GKJ0_9MARC